MREAIIARLAECGLELNLQKTKIVYCKDANRTETHDHEKFTFLGYEYRPRQAKNRKGKTFLSFLPAISATAIKRIREEMRRWKLPRRSDLSMGELVGKYNAKIRGWMQYYGRYYRSELHRVFQPLNQALARWAQRKYKKLRGHKTRAFDWLGRLAQRQPGLWEHWKIAQTEAMG